MFPFSRKPEPEATGPTDADLVRAKIAACDAAINEAADKLSSVSLAAALSDDPDAGKDAIGALTELRTRRDLLSNALRSALEAEKDAAGRLSEREFQARRRSLAQKIGALNRDAQSLTEALAATRDAQRRMVGTAKGILALLPPSLEAAGFERRLGASYLHSLAELEMTRLCDGGLTAIGARPVVSARDADGNLPTLEQEINGLADTVRTAFDKFGPVQIAPVKQPEEALA